MVDPYIGLISLIGLERLIELHISDRNAKHAFSNGGIELGKKHFVAMQWLHIALLIGCVTETYLLKRPFIEPWGQLLLGLVMCAQMLRYWAVFSLGKAWNVRVIVVPGSQAVIRGPYRWLRHPNYVAVVIEGLALPLIHTAWLTALLFFVANAFLLRHRMACEERALFTHLKNYDQVGKHR